MNSATFVLVHGGWHGGWCYRDVARVLRLSGHDVYTPTLTGLGERSHLADYPINLDTHVQDIINVLEWEDLDDVILVGHSYGGLVITGVADQIPEKIGALVYLDALVPERSGESAFTLSNEAVLAGLPSASTDGRSLAPTTAAAFEVVPHKRAWVDSKCVPHPLAAAMQGLRLSGKHLQVRRKHYVLATGWGDVPFAPYKEKFTREPGWTVHELPCGHDVMVDMPQETAQILLSLLQ